jgi:hypothetical protein
MSTKLGSKLAQLANARKKAEEAVGISEEDLQKIEVEKIASNVKAIQLILNVHVDEFNEMAESSLHLALEIAPPCIAIKQSYTRLLTLEMTAKAAKIKRKGEYSSDDYFTIGKAPDDSMTFRNFSAEVAPPLSANQFAERVLMEALGLDQ